MQPENNKSGVNTKKTVREVQVRRFEIPVKGIK